MNAIRRVGELLGRCGELDNVLPPTVLFNEGWMLRLVLDWAAQHPMTLTGLRFDIGSRWYSEAWLGTRFRSRKRGDMGEGFTHADAVIGHFRKKGSRGDIELLPDAKQLTVIEAKMASGLSAGTKNAPTFNQAARNVACMAQAVSVAAIDPATMSLAFVIIAPGSRVAEGTFALADKTAITEVVRQRAVAFDEKGADWCSEAFVPFAARCEITVLNWESVLDEILATDHAAGRELDGFYQRCLQYNPSQRVRELRTADDPRRA